MENYIPPYTISNQIINIIANISSLLTEISFTNKEASNPKLRRENRVKTIQASLAIENNTLSLDQVTDIINGKRILGEPKEICEVKNAFEAYELLLTLNQYSIKDLLYIHGILMKELTNEAGTFRSGSVGIFAGETLVHMAPPPSQVPNLMINLFHWLKSTKDIHPLIKSCVFHYEFEFIHPFSDGNGRMGRMWQTLLLYNWNPIFGWLPIETLIKERQDEYYKILGECDKAADSGKFIEFILNAIYETLLEIGKTDQVTEHVTDQVERLINVIGNDTLTANEIMIKLNLKHRDTFRKNYLLPSINEGFIEMTIPDKPRSNKQKYRLKKKL